MVTQILISIACFAVGAALVFWFLNRKWQQAGVQLNNKIDRLAALGTLKLGETDDSKPQRNEWEKASSKLDRLESQVIPASEKQISPDQSQHKIQELKLLLDNAKVVNELGQQVTASLKLEDSFRHLYETINSIMDAAVMELGIYYWRDNRWQILSNVQVEEGYNNPLAEWAMKNNREVVLSDARNDYARYVFEAPVSPDRRTPESVISFPVTRYENQVGAITIMSFSKNAFNDYHMDMVRSLIPYTAVAVGNALIHEELINTQTQLIHNEKMASLGQIASGIAHEILNPLNFVNNFSQLSKELIPELEGTQSEEEQKELKEQLVSNLDRIHFHGQRAYSIVKNMMMLSRSGSGEKTRLDINRSLEGFLTMAYNSFRSRYSHFEARIEKVLDKNIPEFEMVGEDFGRVMLNMFSNAFYTMNEKLKKQSEGYVPELFIRTTLVNQKIVLMVRDNGLGIPEEIRSKIFLPFFTTKPTGEGTGLGLSISHDIITKGSKGEISVSSETGKGTEMTIILPLYSV